jgi:sensor histidine kinase YesM
LRSIRIPALVIQPLVENAIKHGITECLAGGEVRISIQLEQQSSAAPPVIVISVVDTGVGVTEAALAARRKRGLGLSNIEQRLQHYGGPKSLSIQSKPGYGTTVEARFPLELRDIAAGLHSMKSS